MAYINGKKVLSVVQTQNVVGTMEEIKDANGNLRFIEGDGILPYTVTGLTITYNKWSLSGTHLMFVVAGNFDAGSYDISSGMGLGQYTIPTWVLNKIYPVWNQFIELKTVRATATNWTATNFSVVLRKDPTQITIVIPNSTNAMVFNNDSSFRIQFDLLIDNE